MQLQFQQAHLSIALFNPVDLPKFTVLTGVNGSGKSHLLEAIELRNVAIHGMDNPVIVRFNYETFKLENEGAFNAQQISSEREAAWQYHQQNIQNDAVSWKNNIGNEYDVLRNTCQEQKKSLWGMRGSEPLKSYRTNIKNYFNNPNIKNHPQAQGIYSLIKKLGFGIDELPHDDFLKLYKPFVYKNDFLPNQLGKIIWDYYVKYRGNQVNEFENEKYGKDYEVLTEEQFIDTHGDKPWEILNEILENFDSLEYRVNSPEGSDYFGNYQLKLVHTKKEGLEIDFSGLSSGERILMAMMASVYKASTDNHFPDVLLLDEVDASLHPSMMKNLLEVIKSVFLNRDINVILVTHSPTTIALAPEESVYVMNKDGVDRICKRTRQEALSILTEGFATLDQGIRLFDEVSNKDISIITEGKNTKIMEKACELLGLSNIEIITGIEGVSGKNQLKTLFDFFLRASHTNKVIFLWDCDVSYPITGANNTYPYFIEKNNENTIAIKGIENIFPENLFDDFIKTITRSNGDIKTEFDETRKRDFEEFVIKRNNVDDFDNLKPLFEYINSLLTEE